MSLSLTGVDGYLISAAVLRACSSVPTHDFRNRSFQGRQLLAQWRTRTKSLGPSSSLQTLAELGANPLARALGFSGAAGVDIRDDAAIGALTCGNEPVGLIVSPWGARLDPLWRLAVVEARRRGAGWALLFNGIHLRLLEAARPHSRRYVQFDLDLAIDDEETFAAFWTALNADAFVRSNAQQRPRIEQLVRDSERHASAVCRSLRDGVLQASNLVLAAIAGRPPREPLFGSFEQALTIVFRILFLLFAEARDLVPLWHPIYRRSYSVEALREAAEAPNAAPGFWDSLQASCRLAHGGCIAGDLRVTPFNGRLFAPAETPLADRRDLDDAAARQAVLALSTRRAADGAGLERITYRDLGVDQLGAVYESLLDYEPRITIGSRNRRTVTLETGSGRRKTTGTFYTPQAIAHYLVRQTLQPLVKDCAPDQILQLKVLDPSVGSGAFLVAAGAFLSHAYEEALIASGGCHASDLGPHEQALVRRTITERCLYGVDANPMAVQLARLSLWLASLAGDRPLGFLDHHLLTGNSLIGAWISSLNHAPPIGRTARRDKELPLFPDAALTEALRGALPTRFQLGVDPSNTVEQVRRKERSLAALNHPDSMIGKWRRVADLWCARWFAEQPLNSAAFPALSDWILGDQSVLPATTITRLLDESARASKAHAFFHWELEFPEVFFAENGTRAQRPGFDAVIGNPPWDILGKGEEAVLRFVRDSGVYSVATTGHANRYQLFLERAIALTRPGGRVGLVLPHGIAADHGSGPLRRFLFTRCAVDALVGFENRRAIFPIHRSVRFLLMTATAGHHTSDVLCRLGETDPSVLESAAGENVASDSQASIRITPALLERIGGADFPIPDLHSPIDLAILERSAALFAPLGAAAGWSASFGRELNATEDRHLFNSYGRGLPVVEGKQIQPFHVDLQGVVSHIDSDLVNQHLGNRRARLAYRDVASRSNRLTLIAAVLPANCVSTHSVFCLRSPLPARAQHFLCGLFNSYVLNFFVRLRVTTHVTTSIVGQLPVPARDHDPVAFEEIAALSRLLAKDTSISASARLQARAGRLYQLSDEEFAHILKSFPLIARAERDAAMNEFRNLA